MATLAVAQVGKPLPGSEPFSDAAVRLLAQATEGTEPGLSSFAVITTLVGQAATDGHPAQNLAAGMVDRLIDAGRAALALRLSIGKAPTLNQLRNLLRERFDNDADVVLDLWPAVLALAASYELLLARGEEEGSQEALWCEAGAVAALTRPGRQSSKQMLADVARDALSWTAKRFGVELDELVNTVVEKWDRGRRKPARGYRLEGDVARARSYVAGGLRRRAFDVLPGLTGYRLAGRSTPHGGRAGDRESGEEHRLPGSPRLTGHEHPDDLRAHVAAQELRSQAWRPEIPPGTLRRWKAHHKISGDEGPEELLSLQVSLERRKRHHHETPHATLRQAARGLGLSESTVRAAFHRASDRGLIKPQKGDGGGWLLGRAELEAIRTVLRPKAKR